MENSRNSGTSGNSENSEKPETKNEIEFSFDDIWNRPDIILANQNRESC